MLKELDVWILHVDRPNGSEPDYLQPAEVMSDLSKAMVRNSSDKNRPLEEVLSSVS